MAATSDFAKNKGRLSSLMRLFQELERARSHQDIANAILHEIQTLIGYNNVWIYVLSEERDYAQLLTYAGDKAEEFGSRVSEFKIAGDAWNEEITQSDHICIAEDARTDPRTNKDIVAALGNRTIVNMPVYLEHQRLGAIATGTFGEEGIRVPTQAEIEYLETMTRHVAVVIDRIQFLEERERVEFELRQHQDHLEKVVRERTEELQKLVNMMAGREVRMAELKKTVKKLRSQLIEAGLSPVADDPLKEQERKRTFL
ncbi:MAG: GAF domain-containing protein [Anaerolineae bacterium]|nr:GAF domain-containing protein [Anaerolineae bacterium]